MTLIASEAGVELRAEMRAVGQGKKHTHIGARSGEKYTLES